MSEENYKSDKRHELRHELSEAAKEMWFSFYTVRGRKLPAVERKY